MFTAFNLSSFCRKMYDKLMTGALRSTKKKVTSIATLMLHPMMQCGLNMSVKGSEKSNSDVSIFNKSHDS